MLPCGTAFPLDFGFIPHTKGEDGDPLDVLVFLDSPAAVGVVIECRVVGVLEVKQRKQKGKGAWMRNDRVLAVAACSRGHARLKDARDLPSAVVDEVVHFFEYYNTMEGKEFRFMKTGTRQAAWQIITKQCT